MPLSYIHVCLTMYTSISYLLFVLIRLAGFVSGQTNNDATYTNPILNQPGADPSVNLHTFTFEQ
jgi:hypothetical protein